MNADSPMKRIFPFAGFLALVAGCLGSAPKAPVNWTIEPKATTVFRASNPKYGVVRVAQVSVRAPYDGANLAVLRKDGSIAFDPFNAFASHPAAILRGVTCDVVDASGLFARVVPSASGAAAKESLEVTVTRLALDCRTEGVRTASVAVSVTLLSGRDVVAMKSGEGTMPAGDGNYSAAFSSAYTAALAAAMRDL